jgi:hypothetical protein
MPRRSQKVRRLGLLAIGAIAGRLTPEEVTELGRLYVEVGGAGGRQAAEKDSRIEGQRRTIAKLERKVEELEALLSVARRVA